MSPATLPHIRLVAAVIKHEGRYLITQRRPTAVLPGLWEFPGGKVEAGETDEVALKREMRERVGVEIEVERDLTRRTHHYDGYSVDLQLYQARILPPQELRALRVAAFLWVASQDFDKYPFPAADQATTDLLLGMKR